jgi:predicted adenine nucleotide alpha hydrolase (AANH) superfamily ATPase
VNDRLLLHVCCAPCLSAVQPHFEGEGWLLTGYFRNPNIHPWKEWERRRSALRDFVPAAGLEMIWDEGYPLEDNLSMLLGSSPRCSACYEDRLGAAARKAAATGIGNFSSTLVLSPYQDHGLLRDIGGKVAEDNGVEFVYADLRRLYPESVRLSRSLGLYRQQYCGCVFSERDRFAAVSAGGGRTGVEEPGRLP